VQTLIYERLRGFVDDYAGEQPYDYKYPFNGFAEATRLGFVIGPVLKIGAKNGLMI